MLDLIQDSMVGAQFRLRQKILGPIRLRQSLPVLPGVEERQGELKYYELLLNKAFNPIEAAQINHITDVGCRNWSYASVLANFFNNASLLGVEVDGGRRYWNLYRRRDYADAYAAELRGQGRRVETYFQDFSELPVIPAVQQSQQLLFTFFFPFVSENPCRKWGLPSRFVKFKELLMKAQSLGALAKARTRILSVHQGEWEADEARHTYSELGLAFKESTLGVEEFTKLWPSAYENRIFWV